MKKATPRIADELIHGFEELADALEASADLDERFNCYQVQLDLRPEAYTAERVKATRGLLGASQAVFARFLGASVKTVSQWEQGRGQPSPVACRFMDEIRRNPTYYVGRLRESVVPRRGKKTA